MLEGLDDMGRVVFSTSPSDDLPDDGATNRTDVGSYKVAGVVAVRARHAAVSSETVASDPLERGGSPKYQTKLNSDTAHGVYS